MIKRRQQDLHPPFWLVGAFLYGLSGLTGYFSVLAWIAFVPLFVELEKLDEPAPYLLRVFGFMAVGNIIAYWGGLVTVPSRVLVLAWAAGLQEIILESVPLLLLFPLKKRVSFTRALVILMFLWPLWEWLYHQFPFSMSFLFVGNTQASNIWLIQYVDLFGVWAVTGWVISFNVVLFFQYRYSGLSLRVSRRTAAACILLLVLPAAYGVYRYFSLENDRGETVRLALIRTEIAPFDDSPSMYRASVRRAVQLTDSADQASLPSSQQPDLYVWPEGIASSDPLMGEFPREIQKAVHRWQVPLLTGVVGPTRRDERWGDSTLTNQAVLFPANTDSAGDLRIYEKTRLVPFWEGLPFYRHLDRIAFIRDYHTRMGYKKEGTNITLLPLQTRGGALVHLATPICHEQNFPSIWAKMARKGADVFVQLSFESWFASSGFQKTLANISRIRSIENRRSTARCSNGGITTFIDALGRLQHTVSENEGVTTSDIVIHRTSTLYSRFPGLFPAACVIGILCAGYKSRKQAHGQKAHPVQVQ